jgi:hypothetical protein
MLSALEEGVKGGVWFSLIDKVYRRANLEAAARKVIANKGAAGVDRVTVHQRMRLRSILRKRHKGKGRGRGSDHHRWPNHYFAELGLYSLEQAWIEARRSFRCNH